MGRLLATLVDSRATILHSWAVKLTVKRGCQLILEIKHRAGAVVALLVWITASGYCASEFVLPQLASSGHQHHHGDAGGHTHEVATPAHEHDDHSHDSDPHGEHAHSCCSSLSAAVAQISSPFQFVKSDFGLLYTLTVRSLTQAGTQPELPLLRQARTRGWVFTPEVSLGPALRSLAPPSCK